MSVNSYLPAGEGANHLEWVAEDPVPSDFHALFPPSNLRDFLALEPWQPLIGDEITEVYEVVVDKNQIKNRGGELGSTLYWTVTGFGGNAVTSPTPPKGTYAFEMTTNAEAGATVYTQEIRVRGGEYQSVSVYLASPGVAPAFAKAYLPELNLWLKSDGTWEDTEQDWASETGSAFVLKGPLVTQIPAYHDLVPGGVYTLVVTAYTTGNSGSSAYFDEYVWWGHTNLAAAVGHGLKPGLTAFELHRSTDNFSANDSTESGAFGAPSLLGWPTTYAVLAGMRSERWIKFLADGENVRRHWFGQLWLGQYHLLTVNPLYGIGIDVTRMQQRQETPAGASRVFPIDYIERRKFDLKFKLPLSTDFLNFNRLIQRRGQFGAWPALLIYNDQDNACAAMVRQSNSLLVQHNFIEMREIRTFELEELGWPTFDDPELAIF